MIGSGGRSKKKIMSRGNNKIINQPYLKILCNFTDKTLERKLPDKELSRLLVTTNFTESDGSGSETSSLDVYYTGHKSRMGHTFCLSKLAILIQYSACRRFLVARPSSVDRIGLVFEARAIWFDAHLHRYLRQHLPQRLSPCVPRHPPRPTCLRSFPGSPFTRSCNSRNPSYRGLKYIHASVVVASMMSV